MYMVAERDFKNFYEAFNALYADLSGREVSLKERHIILSPDKCSQFLESKLFGIQGAFDAEVLTFSRLYLKFKPSKSAEHLPYFGAVMLVSSAISKVRRNLKVYKTAAGFSGFAKKMTDTVQKLAAAKITPERLMGFTGAKGLKFDDISLIYAEYLKAAGSLYVDNAGKMSLLISALKNSDLSNIKIYVAGFDRFTRQEEEILEILKSSAASFKSYCVLPPEYRFKTVEFYESDEPVHRVRAIAKRIRRGVADGGSYRDFCVVTGDKKTEAVTARIFTEFGLPYYFDRKLNLGATELFRYMCLLDECKSNLCRRQSVLELVKNFYFGLDQAVASEFENYINKNGISYNGFTEEFNDRNFERIRKKLISDTETFKKLLLNAESPERFKTNLDEFFEYSGVFDKTVKLSLVYGADLSPVTEAMREAASLITYAVKETAAQKKYFELFSLSVAAGELSLLPQNLNSVVIGHPETFRGGKYACVFVPEFCDGTVPKLFFDDGVISDSDLDELKKINGGGLSSSKEEYNYGINELIRLFNLADNIFLGYSKTGEKRISTLSGVIEKGSAKKIYNSFNREKELLYDGDAFLLAEKNGDGDYFNKIAGLVSSADNAAITAAEGVIGDIKGEKPLPILPTLKELCGLETDICEPYPIIEIAPVKEAGRLFLRYNTVSVSRIQKYFECPYKCFLEASLGLKKRDTGEVRASYAGEFLHAAAEKFTSLGGQKDPRKAMAIIADGLLNTDFLRLLRSNPRLADKLKNEAVGLSERLLELNGGFINYGVELKFDESPESALRPVYLELYNGERISINGKIDRVDTDKSRSFARIIDYKTGKKTTFSYSGIYYGTRVQPAVYQAVLEGAGFRPAGIFYYPLSAAWDDGEDAHKLSGAYSIEPELIYAADPKLKEPGYKSNILPAKTTVKGALYKSDYALSEEELAAISGYAKEVITKALNEIQGGNITPSPVKDACKYCDFFDACGYDGPPRATGPVKPAEFSAALDSVKYGGEDGQEWN